MPQLSRRAILGATAAAFASSGLTAGQPAESATRPTAWDAQTHTDALFRSIPRRSTCTARTPAELQSWQAAFRKTLRRLLGLENMDAEVRFAGQARRAEREQLDGYVREKWYLWTEPDVPLPVWVLIPDRPVARPFPLVLTPHGHNEPERYLGVAPTEKERQTVRSLDRDITLQAVREGYLAILPTARGFGETRRLDDTKAGRVSSCRTGLMHAMLFGRTMIGNRVWDISRILDWAMQTWPVDAQRVAVTGNSGGGTTSLFAAACEERITVAVPSCYFCTFQASIGSIHHCECNYVPGLLREAEMYDVAALIAPRPLLAIAGKDDTIFPISGVRDAFERLHAVYKVAGAGERCELYVGDGPHRYFKAGSWPFIRKWFSTNS